MQGHSDLVYNWIMMKRPDFLLPSYDGSKFFWRAGHGSCDTSDILMPGGQLEARVWNDSCDVGFYVVSHRTGESRLFTLVEVGDSDGEVTHSLYKDFASDTTITVFND